MTSVSVCFVSPYAHALLRGEPRQFGGAKGFGGAEVQQCLIGRALAARGFEVRFASYAEGPPRRELCENMEVWTLSPPLAGRFGAVAKTYLDLCRAMGDANARFYYQRCAGSLTGVVGLYALLRRRRFIFSVANDRDVDGRFLGNAGPIQAFLYRMGIRAASAIVVQTEKQLRLLEPTFRRRAVRIPSVCPIPEMDPPPARLRRGLLWIGSMLPKKRPELLLELADKLPRVPITMIAPYAGTPDRSERLRSEISKRSNIAYVEGASHSETLAYYRDHALLVSTSSAEGFPNVFLEAWAHYLPVISLEFDPDEIICDMGLGVHARSLLEMQASVNRLLENAEERERIGERGRAYVERYHAPEVVAEKYADLLREWC